MKKILLLTTIAILLTGCKYVNTKEPYLEAKSAPELKVPEGADKPNSTSTLAVPKAKGGEVFAEGTKLAPPDMPIRTKQSENGVIRIENVDGYPLLSVKKERSEVWTAMTAIKLDNWTVKSKDNENCLVVLAYSDQEARDREKAGFFKKMLTRDSRYTDYSGNFNLSCTQSGQVMQAKFANSDGSVAKSFLADSVMTKLYELLE